VKVLIALCRVVASGASLIALLSSPKKNLAGFVTITYIFFNVCDMLSDLQPLSSLETPPLIEVYELWFSL
jgi:hypothetical protein